MRTARLIFWRGLGAGVGHGYPVCCAIRHSLHAALHFRLCGEEIRPGEGQVTRRGLRFTARRDGRYVPCGIFHRAHR